MPALVIAVSAYPTHAFSKPVLSHIHLLQGLGVEGDAHCGVTIKHRSRVAADPTQPNLRQVHLLHSELFEELHAQGFHLTPGQIGENILTRGIDLLALPVGAELALGPHARVRITGLRNPCAQLEQFQQGLLAAVLDRAEDGTLIRKAGIMGVVLAGGRVCAGDAIELALPSGPQIKLDRV